MEKRGISGLIVSVLLITFAIVSIAVSWIVITNIINEKSEMVDTSAGAITTDLNILRAVVVNDSTINITVRREKGEGDFSKLNFVFLQDSQTEIIPVEASLEELHTGSFSIHLSILNASKVESVGVAPIFGTASGKEITSNIKDSYKIPSSSGNSSGGENSSGEGPTAEDYNNLITSLNPEARWPLEKNGNDYTANGHNPDGGTGPVGGFVPTIIPITPYENCSDWNGDTYNYSDHPKLNGGDGYLGKQKALSVWIVADTIDTFGNGRGIWTEGGGTNSLNMYVFNNGISDNVYCNVVESANIDYVSSTINEGEVYHVGCMFDFNGAGKIDMYINGTLVDSDTTLSVGDSIDSHVGDCAIGGVDQDTDNHLGNIITGNFDGRIADLVYWSDGQIITPQNFSEIYSIGAGLSF